jgi:hypothetical protein
MWKSSVNPNIVLVSYRTKSGTHLFNRNPRNDYLTPTFNMSEMRRIGGGVKMYER